MARKKAQELHGLATKPAADLNPDVDKTAAPRAFELRVRSVPLEAVSDDLNAPLIRDVHVGESHMAGDPGTGFATDSRDGMLKGQRSRCDDAGGEDSVALEGAKQSGGRSEGTGVDNGQGVVKAGEALEEPVLVRAFAREDFAKPANIENTANYKEAKALSAKFVQISSQVEQKTVAVIGGGLSGLACAKYLSDAGHRAVVLEARNVLGGKVSAWQDEDGDWVETGLHIFFGAYPNMMNLFSELGIEDRLQWKRHQMTFAMQEFPGEFTTFEFPGWPAPLNMAAAILGNQKMLSPLEKLQTGPPLLPMLVEGQSFIDAQDECSVTEFCRKYGMPDRIIQEIFIPMAKALDFIDPDRLSMTVVLTAMNRFINETDGSQTAFLDGNQPDRLCQPMVEHIQRLGGDVRLGAVVEEVVLRPDGSVDYLSMRGGEKFSADEYVSAMPVDVLKRLLPMQWSIMPFFRQLDQLEGIPVINIHLWFDRKLRNIDALCFSRSPLLSVLKLSLRNIPSVMNAGTHG
eukprot:s3037_g1.t1